MPREEEETEAVRGGTSGELDAAQDGGDWRGKVAAAKELSTEIRVRVSRGRERRESRGRER